MAWSKGAIPAVGIMVSERADRIIDAAHGPLVLPEDHYCRQLCRLGSGLGLFVYAFDASCFRADRPGMTGYRLEDGLWKIGDIPHPHCIYDRTFCKDRGQRQRRSLIMARLRRRKSFILLNGELPGKWEVYCAMREDDELRQYLPPTYRYEGADSLAELINRYPQGLFLKPDAGMQGRGAVRLSQTPNEWRLDGRDRRNNPVSRMFQATVIQPDLKPSNSEALYFLRRFIGSSAYIVQPCLCLTDHMGTPYDIRALMQKDENGRWSLTGAALREGSTGGVTANLHGGGAAREAKGALAKLFGPDRAARLLERIERLSGQAVLNLESRFGRFAELGLDFGIEPDGRIWLLEANAKPGRASFAADRALAQLAAERPLRYAKLIMAGCPSFNQVQNLVHHYDDAAVDRFLRKYVQEVHP